MNVRFFENTVLAWYQKYGRHHLPWRQKKMTAYQVWVSEVMLQQTQVNRVIPYYQNFLQRFPRVEDLAVATWEEFLPFYAGLGYYARGRNMLKTAQMVVSKYQGRFPQNKSKLLQLPGIGEYTANAILAFAYGQEALALDTNVKKVLARFFVGARLAWDSVPAITLTKLAAKKKDLTAALMDLSSLVCKKNPLCVECPLQTQCRYWQSQGQLEKGLSQKRKTFPSRQARVYLFLHHDHTEYFSKRKSGFTPFILPAKYNSREGIKEYFRKYYDLELSVRPPHQRLFIKGEPVLFVNAQILLGQNRFFVSSKRSLQDYKSKIMKNAIKYFS